MLTSGYRRPGFELVRPVALIIIALMFLVYISQIYFRYIGNDDYTSLYLAWQKSTDVILGKEIHSAYYLQANLLVPLFWMFDDSLMPLFIGRFFTLLLIGGTCIITYFLTKQMVGRTAGFLAPIFVLGSLGMLHRGMDLRPDPLSTLIWMGVFAYILHHAKDLRRRHFFVLGLATGLAFFNREKAALFGPIAYPILLWFYCCNHQHLTIVKRVVGFIKEYIFSVLGFFLMGGIYIGLIAITDDVATYFEVTYAHYFGLGHYVGGVKKLQLSTLGNAFLKEPIFWILAVVGICWRLISWKKYGHRENVTAAGLVLLALFSVAINPAYYTYNLMTLQTLLAPFCAFPLAKLINFIGKTDFSPGLRRFMILGTLLLVLAPRMPDLVHFGTKDTMAHQRNLQQFISKYVDPKDAVFALEGIGLYRPSVKNWRLTAIMTKQHYYNGSFNYEQELLEAKPELMIGSYRMNWLLESDKDFIFDHYVLVTPFIGVLGYQMEDAGEEEFHLLKGGLYVIEATPEVKILVDGSPWKPGETRELKPGSYVMETTGQATIKRHYPKEAMEYLANDSNRPYLIGPITYRIE